MKRIVWLASYPKSGNTWMRALLSNFLEHRSGPAHINQLRIQGIASSREVFDDALTVSASDMSPAEVDYYRPEVYRRLAASATETLYLKAHDACLHTCTGDPIFPADVTLAAVYVVRNPMDVAISLAHHRGRSIDETITFMANKEAQLAGNRKRLDSQLTQKLLSWSGHVTSWLQQPDFPVHCVRYEDLIASPHETFRGALRFLGLPDDPTAIQQALERSAFSVLKKQEQQDGFKERPAGVTSFFRRGVAGEWKHALTPDQIQRIAAQHGSVMLERNYLLEENVGK